MNLHNIPQKDSTIFEFDLTDRIDLGQVRSDILDYKIQFKNSRDSSIHAWHSGFFTHLKTDKFTPLVRIIEDCANEIGRHFNKESVVNTKFSMRESWAIVYNKYGYTEEHAHFPLSYSAVCYISADNCSPIQFGDFEVPAKTGKLLIFPGHLKHRVPAMMPKHSERIVYVGNLYPEFDYSELNKIAKSVVLDNFSS